MLFHLGGKMNETEVPHETATREVYEESGLKIELYDVENKLNIGWGVLFNYLIKYIHYLRI